MKLGTTKINATWTFNMDFSKIMSLKCLLLIALFGQNRGLID
jgi:hypothetical protein